MKINFLGDSITEGVWTEKPGQRYASKVCEILGATENNYGVSGTRIASQEIPSDEASFDETFYTRACRMEKDADLVFVFGGTNDHGHGDALMGDMDSESEYTFYGAMKKLVEKLLADYGKEKLLFLLPLPKFNQESIWGENGVKVGSVPPLTSHDKEHPIQALYPLSAYIAAEKEVLEHYGVRYLDFADKFPEPQHQAEEGYFKDGLHPNVEGHAYLAGLIAEEIRKFLNK